MVYWVLQMIKKKNDGRNKYYSLSNKLRKDGRSSEEFEILFNNLSLEEVIGLKLELASKFGLSGKMYGLPNWYSLRTIVKDAVLKYAMSATRSKREAARFLGLQDNNFNLLLRKHEIDNYFSEEVDKKQWGCYYCTNDYRSEQDKVFIYINIPFNGAIQVLKCAYRCYCEKNNNLA